MRTLSATEVARSFSRVLDSLEHGGEEIVIMRNNHPVARLLPGARRVTAKEAFEELSGTLDVAEGKAWLEDMQDFDRPLSKEIRDPWA